MPIKRRLLATFLAVSLLPLLLLGAFSYWSSVRRAEASLHARQQHDLSQFAGEITQTLEQATREVTVLSRSPALKEYLDARNQPANASLVLGPALLVPEIPPETRAQVAALLTSRSYVHSVALYNDQRPLFMAQRKSGSNGLVEFQTRDFLSNTPRPDDRAWAGNQPTALNSKARLTPVGSTTVFTAPILGGNNYPKGSLVVEVRLEPILAEAAKGRQSAADVLAVIDRTETILYHTNDAVKNQPVATAQPFLAPLARQMMATESGSGRYAGPDNHIYSAIYRHLPSLDVFAAQASNRDAALAPARNSGNLILAGSVVLGVLAALALAFLWQKQARGIDRVSEGVEARARGELDRRIDLRSRDDLRPLADNLDILTKQLREQIARETESQQFQSFIRLSAILTHDLKNSIEALSLTVSNMERHFENAEFRADAMKTLRSATENLSGLVARLSNPVTTLSGEHKRPRAIDIVPMLRRVVSRSGVDGLHAVELKLPESLYALVDVERINKVVENLVINAREAMGNDRGTITIEAGTNSAAKPFFSVTDTGVGMSRRFIEERLFRPFATTKKRGVGLGLYTCREVVRANGGAIEVSSKEGAGTTFTVVLPSPPTDSQIGSSTHRH